MFIFDIDSPQGETTLDNVTKGKTYIFPDLIKRESFGDKEYNYFYEKKTDTHIQLMANKEGKKVFAVATNDCASDNFKKGELAKIIVDENNYIVIANKSDELHEYPTIAIFKVGDIELVDGDPVLFTECIEKFRNINEILGYKGKFSSVIDHVTLPQLFTMSEYLSPKYCYNTKRVVTTRLFRRSVDNEFYSFLSDGTRLILNNKSDIYNNANIANKNYFVARCFYSKKFGDKNVKFVDGIVLDTLKQDEIESYIKMSDMDSRMAESSMKLIKTSTDESFLSIANLKGEIRIIYRSFKGFISFPLNDFELKFVKDTVDVL